MIEITQEEVLALNVLNNIIKAAQAEFQRTIAAQKGYISLLELKYNAKFNPATGQLEEIKPEKDTE